MKFLMSIFLLAASLNASTNLSGDALSLSTTPTQFSTSLGHVAKLTFRVIPGYCGKVYIGLSTMNVSTLADVLAVLWPNCNGGLNDEYVIEDPRGLNGFDSSTIYIAGQIGGEKISWQAMKTACDSSGCPVASLKYKVVFAGPVLNASATQAAPIPMPKYCYLGSCDSGWVSALTIRTVPGHSGKIRIGGGGFKTRTQPDSAYQETHAVLFPFSSGMHAPASWGERDPNRAATSGTIVSSSYGVFSEVNSEFPLVATFRLLN